MAKRQRLLYENVAIAVMSVVVQIRTAEAGGTYADLKVCWAWRGDGTRFLGPRSAVASSGS